MTHIPRADDGGYDPPAGPEDNPWPILVIKMAGSMTLAYVVALACGFEDPTWAVLAAAFLSTRTPVQSAKGAAKRLIAVLVGAGLGALGAYAATWLSGIPAAHVALVGAVAAILAAKSADYMFTAVVGIVVTFAASGGGDPIAEVVVTTICMVLVGCAVAPIVVWAVERVRMAAAGRRA